MRICNLVAPEINAILFLGFFLAQGAVARAAISEPGRCPEQEFTRSVQREYSTTADGMTAIYNQNGRVNIKTWQNNTVRINIAIVVHARDERAAESTFDRIKVNFLSTAGYVKAETVIEPPSFWSSDDSGYEVNYDVWMPAGNQLDLKNKYGNSWLGPLQGKLTAEIRYGELRTEAISADADISLNNGKVWITRANNITGQMSYSTLNVTEARNVQLDSRYSEARVDKASNVRITSKCDEFNIGNVDELRLQTKYAVMKLNCAHTAFITAQYSDLDIATLSNALDADVQYGSLDVTTLSRHFNDVNIVAKYTPVVIGVERGCAFNFDAEAQDADVHYPEGVTLRKRSDTGATEIVKGYLGNPNAKSKVKARLISGDIIIK